MLRKSSLGPVKLSLGSVMVVLFCIWVQDSSVGRVEVGKSDSAFEGPRSDPVFGGVDLNGSLVQQRDYTSATVSPLQKKGGASQSSFPTSEEALERVNIVVDVDNPATWATDSFQVETQRVGVVLDVDDPSTWPETEHGATSQRTGIELDVDDPSTWVDSFNYVETQRAGIVLDVDNPSTWPVEDSVRISQRIGRTDGPDQ